MPGSERPPITSSIVFTGDQTDHDTGSIFGRKDRRGLSDELYPQKGFESINATLIEIGPLRRQDNLLVLTGRINRHRNWAAPQLYAELS